MLQFFFAQFKGRQIMISDNILHLGLFYITAHICQMIEAFIAFRMFRSVRCRQHLMQLPCHVQCIDHRIFGTSRMDIETVDHKFSCTGIEILIGDLSFFAAVYGIGIIRTKSIQIKG